jgi:translation elongation factor EF-G
MRLLEQVPTLIERAVAPKTKADQEKLGVALAKPAAADPGQDMRANAVVINAMAPLANMFGYVNNLRSGTHGRANFTKQFDHYEPVAIPGDDDPFPPAVGMRGSFKGPLLKPRVRRAREGRRCDSRDRRASSPFGETPKFTGTANHDRCGLASVGDFGQRAGQQGQSPDAKSKSA